ncbi:MAG: PD-(D/E)XK nuclease family protein [Mycobacteriales bacterium]
MSTPLQIGLPHRGNAGRIQLTASKVAGSGQSCPAHLALEAYPNVWPDIPGWRPEPEPHPIIAFAVMNAIEEVQWGKSVAAALNEVLSRTRPEQQPMHPGVEVFVRAGVARYIEWVESRRLELGSLTWIPRREMSRDDRTLTCWAVNHDAPDGIRELHRLRHGRVRGTSEADQLFAIVAGRLAVDGHPKDAAPTEPQPLGVRIIEFSLGDGGHRVVYEKSAEQVRADYASRVSPTIPHILNGSELRPGWDCARCNWVSACPAVPQVAGLLGQPSYGGKTRSVSASDLDRYAICPSLYFLRNVSYLPGEVGHGSAQSRGIAVHRWLAAAHSRPGHPGCTPSDLDERLGGLTEDEHRAALPFLRQHREQGCPLGFGDTNNVRVEPRISVFDSHANVVVAATPDLTFTAGSRYVWRETKTTSRALPADAVEAMQSFLSCALDLLLLHDQVPEGGDDALIRMEGVVELEVLRAEDSAVYLLDTADEQLVSLARHIVASAALAWHRDAAFAATPGQQCTWCVVREWCPSRNAATEGQDAQREVDDAMASRVPAFPSRSDP